MHAIGNGMDVVLCKHLLRYTAVPFRHAVDVVAVVEREIGHVQHAVGAEFPFTLVKSILIASDELCTISSG